MAQQQQTIHPHHHKTADSLSQSEGISIQNSEQPMVSNNIISQQIQKNIQDEEQLLKLVATIQLDSHSKLLTLHPIIEKEEDLTLNTNQENYLIRNIVYPCNSLLEKHTSHLDKHYSLGVVIGIIILCVISMSLVIPLLIVDLAENSFIYFLIVIPFIVGIVIGMGLLFYFLRRKIMNNHLMCEQEIERLLRIEEERIRESTTAAIEQFFTTIESNQKTIKLQLDYPNIRKISLKNTWKFLTDSPSILIYIGYGGSGENTNQ